MTPSVQSLSFPHSPCLPPSLSPPPPHIPPSLSLILFSFSLPLSLCKPSGTEDSNRRERVKYFQPCRGACIQAHMPVVARSSTIDFLPCGFPCWYHIPFGTLLRCPGKTRLEGDGTPSLHLIVNKLVKSILCRFSCQPESTDVKCP